MGSFGGFYKGDKKKKKKQAGSGQQAATSGPSKPVFVAPKVVEKKKKWE